MKYLLVFIVIISLLSLSKVLGSKICDAGSMQESHVYKVLHACT
ncbi:hypothetical protein [Vibrio agarivorans]|uniref:Uncharacterized protein n=1 Tax=Vibrio agarivorans TaxID=153622 RepID=A0ABT7Y7F1_9VIBR|nr:hypothetical protein [Vibrio agarivorans]MDN2483985.1 hypothetical protein [Vibrio agarivorans]